MSMQRVDGTAPFRFQRTPRRMMWMIGFLALMAIGTLLAGCGGGGDKNKPVVIRCDAYCPTDPEFIRIDNIISCGRTQWNPPKPNDGQPPRGSDNANQSIDPTVLFANTPPTADAGIRLGAAPGETVTLDGSGSSDNESTTLTYAWRQASGPRVAISDAAQAQPTFTVPLLITENAALAFRLTVTDGAREVSHDTMQVDVAVPVEQSPEGGRMTHILRGHEHAPDDSNAGITVPSISADGRLVLTRSGDNPTVHIWDAQTGELVHALHHGNPLRDAMLSADGRVVLTGGAWELGRSGNGRAGLARLWDAATGELLRTWEMRTLRSDSSPTSGLNDIENVMLSADGHTALASSSGEGVGAWLWDATTDERLHVLAEERDRIDFVTISADGRLALTRDEEGVHLWHVATGTKLRRLAESGTFTLSADGGLAMSGRTGGTEARLFNTATGDELCVLDNAGKSFEGALLSANGGTALMASTDGTVRFWDIAACGEPHVLGQHQGTIRDMDLSDDGRIALTAGGDGTARLWSTETGGELHVLRGHEGIVYGAALSADGRIAVTTGGDDTARLWNVKTGELLHEFSGGQGEAAVESVALNADGSLAFTGGSDFTARTWDTDTGTQRSVLDGQEASVYFAIPSVWVAMSTDGNRRLTGSGRLAPDKGNYAVELWGTSTSADTLGGYYDTWGMALTADGTMALMGNGDGRARLADLPTGDWLGCLDGDYYVPVVDVALDARGRLALTGGADGTMRLWNAQNGELLHKLQAHETQISGVALSADGRFALTGGGRDQIARLWNAETGEELLALAHASSVTDVVLSTDGSLALTADANGTAWLWDWDAPDGEQLYALRGHEKYITSVALNADGTTVLTGSRDGTARLWEITINR